MKKLYVYMYGLWDEHTAIKWVHKYIKDFGGDPNNVTIFGVSAGAASVLYQSLFPGNRGLFQRVIGMSGSITCPWSFQPNPLEVTTRFAALIGCDTTLTAEDIVRCIESKSEHKLKETLDKEENGFVKFPMEFVPVIDGDFLTTNPYDIINKETSLDQDHAEVFASLDFMTGIVSGEGVMNVGPFVGVKDSERFTVSRDDFVKKMVPEVANLMFGDDIPDVVTDLIIHKYSNWSDLDHVEHSRTSYLEMTGDYVFNYHAKLVADMHANLSAKSDIGGKTFAYLSRAIPSQHILWTPTWVTTANHADDCTFLFGYDKKGYTSWTMPYSEDHQPTEWELRLSKLYMTLFTNFAKSGDPHKPVDVDPLLGTTWPQYDSTNSKYLTFDSLKTAVRDNFCSDSYDFWYRLLPKLLKTTICEKGSLYSKSETQSSCHANANCPP